MIFFGYKNLMNEIIWNYNSAPRRKNSFGDRHDVIFRYCVSEENTFNEIREPYSENINIPESKKHYYHPDGKVIGDVWNIKMIGQNDKTERVDYKTQKPKELIKRIIYSFSNEGDTVADFYLGSGTTAEVCYELKRNFIGCDISEKAIEITKKRLEKRRGERK